MANYALGDLHGRLDIYLEIKKFLSPEDTVYFLGDAIDRGPQSWELFKALIEDPQFIFLKGNHEDMMYDAYVELKKNGDDWDPLSLAFQQVCLNGGYETLTDILNDPDSGKYMRMMKDLPTEAAYLNDSRIVIFLSHAGFTPAANDTPTIVNLLWDRGHFADEWDNQHFQSCVVVHGHTPVNYMWQYLGTPVEEQEFGAFWYCDNHKICLDTGAYATGIAVLLNLDTFDEEIFYLDPMETF